MSVADGRVTVRRYWSCPVLRPLHHRRPCEYVEEFAHQMRLATRDSDPIQSQDRSLT